MKRWEEERKKKLYNDRITKAKPTLSKHKSFFKNDKARNHGKMAKGSPAATCLAQRVSTTQTLLSPLGLEE
jgi:hypothetical protein